ncbi:MAG: ribulose-phosphate 3-epimerase [Chitinivibrionales bacterium]
MERTIKIAPSILAADMGSLKEEVISIQEAGADMIHCDIMDGHFVPNISFGPMVVEAVKKCVSIPLDVHLMISEPQKYINGFVNAGADIITIHPNASTTETPPEPEKCIEMIKSAGKRAGIAVNPDISVDTFLPFLDRLDLVLIMSVYAGFGGQKFLPEILPKLRNIRERINTGNQETILEVDGGINSDTAGPCIENGADMLVAGSYIFKTSNYKDAVDSLRQ